MARWHCLLSVVQSCHHSAISLQLMNRAWHNARWMRGWRGPYNTVITNKNIIMYELSSNLPTGHILCLVCNINIAVLSSLKYFLNVKIRELDKLVLESWKRFFVTNYIALSLMRCIYAIEILYWCLFIMIVDYKPSGFVDTGYKNIKLWQEVHFMQIQFELMKMKQTWAKATD